MKIRHLALRCRLGFIPLAILLTLQTTHAGSATWNLNPSSGIWNKAANWTPNTAPNGPADTATFAFSNTTAVSILNAIRVDGIVFNPGASAFTISTNRHLTFTGAGIVNNSGIGQNIVALIDSGQIAFTNSATAGDATLTQQGDGASSPLTSFFDTSTAGNATFINQGGGVAGGVFFFNSSTAANGMFFNQAGNSNGGSTQFYDTTTAGNATFICDGGSASAPVPGDVHFFDDSSGDNATFICNGASASNGSVGVVLIADNATAGNAAITANGGTVSGALGGRIYFVIAATAESATLIANGGTNGGLGATILFNDDSLGDKARVQVFDTGTLSVFRHNAPGISVGSIEGNGEVVLGANNLTVGTNNLNTIFAGGIRDGNFAPGGSLIKVGAGTLVLTSANTYTGGTVVAGSGTLLVNNRSGAGTGSGCVQVSRGRLGGRGTIAGAVTVGTGASIGAVLTPGESERKPNVLTIQNMLTFNSDATYLWKLDANAARAAEVIAQGVVITNGALFSPSEVRAGTVSLGTVFTVIDNTAATPIAGAFSNLADGAILTVNGNNFQADYEGGDGNDLTLAVVS